MLRMGVSNIPNLMARGITESEMNFLADIVLTKMKGSRNAGDRKNEPIAGDSLETEV